MVTSGQWFEPLPEPVTGTRRENNSPMSPTHLVANSRPSGRSFMLGVYHSANETFTPSGVTSLTDAGHQFNWAALQYAHGRLMNIGWVTGIGLRWEGKPVAPRHAPNSLLSLVREVKFDTAIGLLVSKPVRTRPQLHVSCDSL